MFYAVVSESLQSMGVMRGLPSAPSKTVIPIRTESDTIRLTTQQAELSDLRSSGIYASIYSGFFKNWHKENLDGTLKALTELGNN